MPVFKFCGFARAVSLQRDTNFGDIPGSRSSSRRCFSELTFRASQTAKLWHKIASGHVSVLQTVPATLTIVGNWIPRVLSVLQKSGARKHHHKCRSTAGGPNSNQHVWFLLAMMFRVGAPAPLHHAGTSCRTTKLESPMPPDRILVAGAITRYVVLS